jgi:signal transduction histidine kinase
LLEIDSFVIVEEGSGEGAKEAQARLMAARAAAILRGEDASALEMEEEIYRNIEASREPLNPQPDEAFRAWEAFCGAALAAIARQLPPDTPPAEVVAISLALEGVVTQRISRRISRVLKASYIDYLMTKVRETRDEERRRFSRDLHDRLAHDVASVRANLELYEELENADPQRARGRLRYARQAADEALGLVRDFASEFRQSEASEGLRLALENLIRISVPQETRMSISFDGDEAHLPDYVRDQLYLILREGVRNVVAHAETENMEVEVGINRDEVMAAIMDVGMGFISDGTVLTEGLGISSMRERAELLGGSFELSSRPDGGPGLRSASPWRDAGERDPYGGQQTGPRETRRETARDGRGRRRPRHVPRIGRRDALVGSLNRGGWPGRERRRGGRPRRGEEA